MKFELILTAISIFVSIDVCITTKKYIWNRGELPPLK